MIVKIQKPITIRNNCDCIVDENELINAILWYSKKPVVSQKSIYMHGKYPAVSIHNEKIHVHRLLMMYQLRRRLKTREYSHHKDGNKMNATIDNLLLLESSEHQHLHNARKTLSMEHRQKISEANTKRAGIKKKKLVNICLKELHMLIAQKYSINKIAKHFNCDWSTVKNRIHDNPEFLEVAR